MNLITKLTYAIVPICGLIIVVALIYALIKYIKKKKEYKAKLGYNALTTTNKVNHIKTKARALRNVYRIPLALCLCFDDLNRDSSVKYARFLNKLLRKYLKRRKYYKKRVQEDYFNSNQVYNRVAGWLKSHKKEAQAQKIDCTKFFNIGDFEK